MSTQEQIRQQMTEQRHQDELREDTMLSRSEAEIQKAKNAVPIPAQNAKSRDLMTEERQNSQRRTESMRERVQEEEETA
jgi:hypothetical protein